MSSNVGLTTPRGSGTSGYIQRNLSALKPRDTGFGAPYPPPLKNNSSDSRPSYPQQRQPDQEILAHDRQREIEKRVFELRDRLEEAAEAEKEGEKKGERVGRLDEEEIERRCEELRTKLMEEEEEKEKGRGKGKGGGGRGDKGLKPHQVHELAEAKIRESERLRVALGIGENKGKGRAWISKGGLEGKGEKDKDSDRKDWGRGREWDGERYSDRDRDRDRDRYWGTKRE